MAGKGYFSINNIPILYFENEIQAQTIRSSWEDFIRIHNMNLKDLREWLFLDCTLLLNEEEIKGLTRIDMGIEPDKDFNLCAVETNCLSQNYVKRVCVKMGCEGKFQEQVEVVKGNSQ